jgi:hypothetical protein
VSLSERLRPRASIAAIGLAVLAPLVRAAVGGYLGATPLLVVACGLVLVPFLPAELDRLAVQVAVVPALGVASFATLLTTVSVVGVPLDAVSIPLAVAAFVVPMGLIAIRRFAPRPPARSRRHDVLALAALAAITAFAFASSWDAAYPFEARGTDWGHYLLYAEGVASSGDLLLDDRLAGDEGWVFADPPAVGAVYGSVLILDGVSSWSLTAGIAVVSALAVLSVFAAGAVLWGNGAGLVAAGAYAVAPIRLGPSHWHGLGTMLAILFVPLVLLSLALLFRGARGRRHAVFLAAALVGVAVTHSTSAVVVAVLVALVPVVDLVVRLARGRSDLRVALHGWWSEGVLRPLALAVALACILGAGVIVHLWRQARALGAPVDYRFLDPHWLSRAALETYFGRAFLLLSIAATVLVLTSRRLRGDPALLALASLGLACVVVSQLWRAHVSFEYQRVVYYAGVGIALVVGAAFVRYRAHLVWAAVAVLALILVARSSVGLRLPERVVRGEPRDAAVSGLTAFRTMLDRGAIADTERVVSDGCFQFAVPYLVRRPTLAAFSERQVGFVDRLPVARQATVILSGEPEGRALASRLGVRYAVADPACVPDLAAQVHGTTVLANDGVTVVRLPASG